MTKPPPRRDKRRRVSRNRSTPKTAPVTSPRAIERAEKTARVLELRLQGWTLAEIGASVGVTAKTVHVWIEQAMAERIYPLAEQMRNLTLDRYEALLTQWMPEAMQGDPVATDRAMNILRAERELLGLDQPQKLDVRGHVDHEGKIEVAHDGKVEHVHRVVQVEFIQPVPRTIHGEVIKSGAPAPIPPRPMADDAA